MPLPLPVLDDRRWADLVEEGRALIPLHAPEWTDHNVHDPGITLVELLAFLAEMDLYQVNRVPERHRLKFLSLLGVRPRPPAPAQTLVAFRLRYGDDPLTLPPTLEVEATSAFGETIRFRTLGAVRVVAGELQAIQVEDASGFRDLTVPWRRGDPVALLGPDPRPGSAAYLGFSSSLAKDEPVSLALAVGGRRVAAEVRGRLEEERRSREEACRPLARPCGCPARSEDASVAPEETPPAPPLLHHSARTAWEFLAATGEWRALEAASGDVRSGQVRDETRALTLDGRVTLALPDAMARRRLGAVGEELYNIRCRLVSGAYDAPPTVRAVALNGVAAEQAVAGGSASWSIVPGAPVEGEVPARGARVRLDAWFDDQGRIARVAFAPQGRLAFLVRELQLPTATEAGRLIVEAVTLGWGTGRPNQQVTTPVAPVVESSLEVFTLEEGRPRAWARRPDFDASGASDAHAVLDPVAGSVSFGDGERGRVPPDGVPVLAAFDTTRAEEGNLDRDHPVNWLSDSPHNRALFESFEGVKKRLALENPVPAEGGAPAETVAEAAGRALERVERPTRAVTGGDHEFLAHETPGVTLARVWARPNRHPAFPCFEAPGVTTVIVMPYLPIDRPVPSPGLLRAVSSYLLRRRVLGTRVEVVGPTYLGVIVKARVRGHAGVDRNALAGRVATALDAFFDPLTGGPDGGGWPFGRDVYRSEVLQVIDGTEGVDHVLSLELVAEGRPPQCANVCLAPTDLVDPGAHQIEVVTDEPC